MGNSSSKQESSSQQQPSFSFEESVTIAAIATVTGLFVYWFVDVSEPPRTPAKITQTTAIPSLLLKTAPTQAVMKTVTTSAPAPLRTVPAAPAPLRTVTAVAPAPAPLRTVVRSATVVYRNSTPVERVVPSAPVIKRKKPLFAYDVNFLYMLQASLNGPHNFQHLFEATMYKIDNWIPYYVIMEIIHQSKQRGNGRIGKLSRMANSLLEKLDNMEDCISVGKLEPDSAIKSMPYITNDDIIINSIGKYGQGRATYVCTADKEMGIRAMSVGTIVHTVDQFYHILRTEYGITKLPKLHKRRYNSKTNS